MHDVPVNRVAASGLITLRPEEWIPAEVPIALDLRDYLFMGLILKEKDFREQLKTYDWQACAGKPLCLYCSADAIIPDWAYMLVAAGAAPFAGTIFYGTPEQWINHTLLEHIAQMDVSMYQDQRVIVKGCTGKVRLGPQIFLALTQKLVPVVASLMFGEPCSTVPVYKRRRTES